MEKKEKGKELFDFLNGIYTDQTIGFFDTLTTEEQKKYKGLRYMLNRFISMNVHYLPVVNAIQKYTNIPERLHYLFFARMLPKQKQFNKYIKGSKDDIYPEWLVNLVAKHFHVSRSEAITYIEIYYRVDKKELRKLCELYGTSPDDLKKIKL